MSNNLEHKDWSGRTDGLPFMHRSLIIMLRALPLCLFYFIASFVVPFYMIFSRKTYKSMYKFFREGFNYGTLKSFVYVYLNHYCFAQIIIDRFGAYAGKKYDFVIEGRRLSDELEYAEGGFVQLSAHMGNYEISGYSVKSRHKKFNILSFSGEAGTIVDNRKKLFINNNIEIIFVREDLSHIFAMSHAIENGEIVSMMADRNLGSQKTVRCSFLSHDADFPLGPFSFAISRNVPVLAVFVMREGLKKYRIIIRKIESDKNNNRIKQATQMANEFASITDEIIRKYPTQWFNYFDFWQHEN